MPRDFVTLFLCVLLFFIVFFVGGGGVILGIILICHGLIYGSGLFVLAGFACFPCAAAVIALCTWLGDRL